MKYIANPVTVDACKIGFVGDVVPGDTGIAGEIWPAGSRRLLIDGNDGHRWTVTATAEMLARMTPVPGDYWVIQEDGYAYLNPKAVFERKYSAVEPEPEAAESPYECLVCQRCRPCLAHPDAIQLEIALHLHARGKAPWVRTKLSEADLRISPQDFMTRVMWPAVNQILNLAKAT